MEEDDVEELHLSLNESARTSDEDVQNSGGPTSVSEDREEVKPVLDDVEEWRNRKESKDKLEAIDKLRQFKVRITALEKERTSQVFNKNNEFRKDFCELEEMEVKLSADRRKERETLKSQLKRISASVNHFKREIDGPKNIPNFIEKLKVIMEEIEGNIMKYKQDQGAIYEEMMKTQKQLALDIESFQKKMRMWNINNAVVKPLSKTKQDDNTPMSVPPEVAAFEKFLLQTGGHQGGWDEYDHQAFLKLRRRIKGLNDFLTAAENEIPTRNRNDIIQHDQWYKEYLSLRDNKRTAIAKWKDMKMSEKQELIEKIEKDIDIETQKEQKRQQILEQEKIERFSKLEQWKMQKQLHNDDKIERMEDLHQQERLRKQKLDLARREEMKKDIEEYRLKRKEKEQMMALTKEAKEMQERAAKRVTEEEKERIKERDKRITEEKKRRLQSKEKQRIEKEKRLSKLRSQVEVRVQRDPNRLFELTKGWKERQKVTTAESNGPMLNFQHRQCQYVYSVLLQGQYHPGEKVFLDTDAELDSGTKAVEQMHKGMVNKFEPSVRDNGDWRFSHTELQFYSSWIALPFVFRKGE